MQRNIIRTAIKQLSHRFLGIDPAADHDDGIRMIEIDHATDFPLSFNLNLFLFGASCLTGSFFFLIGIPRMSDHSLCLDSKQHMPQ